MKKSLLNSRLGVSLGVASGLSILAAATPVAAQLEEIVVTAQYREQGLQDVPLSISAVTGEMVTENAIIKVEDLQSVVPNFNYTETGISTQFLIRGIGSGVNQGFEQSVGLYIDGVHYPRGQQARIPFLDLERVEVLRGPQSILFGKNSVAGALNITTAKPTEEFEGSVFVSHEFEYDETIVEGYLSGTIAKGVRGRVAARSRDLDGWIENLTLDTNEPERDETTFRTTFEFDFSDNVFGTLKYERSEFDTLGRNIEIENAQPGPSGLTYPEILVNVFGQDVSNLNVTQDGRRSSNGDISENEMQTLQFDLDWSIGDFELKSITAYQDLDYNEVCDCDFTGANVFTASLNEEYEQISQEFRLTSPVGDKFDYIVGVFLQDSEHRYNDAITVANNSILIPAINARIAGAGDLLGGTEAARNASVDSTVLSAFAQFNWQINDAWRLQLGGRITNEEKDGFRSLSVVPVGGGAITAKEVGASAVYASAFQISSTNLAALGATGEALLAQLGSPTVTGDRDTTEFSPDVKLVWDVNDDTMLYASWARGFKSGGFDFRANNRGASPTAADAFEFDDEEANNFELGGKFKFGSAAELNATVFYTEFDDLQVSIFDGVLGFNVGNAAGAEVYGVELDGRWALNDYVTLSGGMAFTDFEFTDYPNGQCYFGQTPDSVVDGRAFCDYSGLANALVADFSGNLALDFVVPMGDYELNGVTSVFYSDDYQTSAVQDPLGIQDSFAKVDLRLGYGPVDGSWEVALLVKNLTDEITQSYQNDAPLAGSTFGAKTNYTFFSPGRQTSLQLRYNF